jgi:hypothetical protein
VLKRCMGMLSHELLRLYRAETVVRLTNQSPAWVRSDGRPADRAWMLEFFRSWARGAGLPWREYSGISFRRGGAQTLA